MYVKRMLIMLLFTVTDGGVTNTINLTDSYIHV